MRINRFANLWKQFAKAIHWREEKKKKKKAAAAVTPTPKDYKEKKPENNNNEQGYNACKKRAAGRYVIPMRSAPFLPGEETGAQQFGISGKGRFFTAGIFFERLEMQGSKRARQVRKQVDADWSSRAKLTRHLDQHTTEPTQSAGAKNRQSSNLGLRNFLGQQAEAHRAVERYDTASLDTIYRR
jgi:hypothetical protein